MDILTQNKILLVHPLGYKMERAGQDVSRIANIMPPLGLASMAAYLNKKNIKADIVDCFAKPFSDQFIRDYLTREKPSFIGLSCTTSSFLDGVRIAEMAKNTLPGIKAVFGGPHVSALKNKVLADFPQVDFVVAGEGEETLAELLACDGEINETTPVPGMVYRDKNGIPHFSGYRAKGIDLDTLPFPAYEKLDGYPQAYKLPIFNYPKVPNSSCISSRGCPYACSYCDRSVFGSSFRYNSAEYLYEHLKYLRDRFHIRHINFYDDQFTFNRKRIEAFCRMMIDKPLGMTFNCAVRAEHIDLDLARMMKEAGCWMISLGVETGDEDLLAQHRKNPDLEMLAEKIRMIHKVHIRVKGLLMLGLPGETKSSIQKSMDYVFSLPIDDINVSKFTPFPGTPLYEKAHELGTFDEDWEKMDCMHFLFVPKGMTGEHLEKLFVRFYRKHFMRPKMLLGYIAMIWRSPDSWKRFLTDFGGFFRFVRTDTRIADPEKDLKISENQAASVLEK
jgi:anaerobic magnesium-protoporphyrin IX monomethyl ester cyclase